MAVLFLVFLFSGCMEKNSDLEINKFIGTWETAGTSLENDTWTFYSNGTLKIVSLYIENYNEETFLYTTWFSYKVNSSKLCFISKEAISEPPTCFDYEFSDNKN